jgi:PPOX class probable F420-dependent enzyme
MSRRDQIRMSDAEVAEFLDGRHTMNVATHSPDGTIHLVAMWYGSLDGKPAFWTYRSSQKILNLKRDPRITCLVETGEDYAELKGVELVGTGAVVEDQETVLRIGEDVYRRYFGGDYNDAAAAGVAASGAKRFGVIIDVDKVVSWDHNKLGGTY